MKWVVLECPWKSPTRWPPTLTISTWLNIQSIQIFLSSLIFWSILLTYFVFFKITLYGLHLLPIYGWNNLFPLVLIGWVTKKGRNWLKSPQIDYLLTFFNVTYWCYFDFFNYLYWSKSKEVSFNHFY